MQQGGQSGVHDHEDGRVVLAGEPDQGLVDLGLDREGHGVAAVGGHGGPGPVEGQLHLLGQPGERRAPVVELTGQSAVRVVGLAQRAPLPGREVGVLDGQLRPARLLSPGPGRVRGGEVAGERGHGGAVAGDVVQDEEQHVLARAEVEQGGAQRGLGGEVEGGTDGVGDVLAEGVLVGADDGQRRHGRQDHLVGAVPVLGEDRTQRLVPQRQVVQGGGERGHVEVTAQPQRDGQVVRRGRALEAMQEPQPFLGVRQRQASLARLCRDAGAARSAAGEPGRELRHGRRFEQHRQFEVDVQRGPDAAGQPGHQQGVAAEREEVVVDRDLAHLEHLGEQPAQDLLLRGARPAPGGVGLLRDRQCPAVELAVRGERHDVQLDDLGRDHVLRQPCRKPVAQCLCVDRNALGCGHDVPDEPLPVHGRGGLGDGRVVGQRVLDLAEFDAQTAQLDLVVGAAEVLQLAVRRPARHVPGAVHHRPGRPVRARDEPFGGQAGPVQVATGQLDALDVQLAGCAGGDRHECRVEHVGAGVGDRAADQHGLGAGRRGPGGDIDCGLGGAVGVEEHGAGVVVEAADQLGGQGLVAGDDQAHGVRQPGLGQIGTEHGRAEVHDRDGLLAHQPFQVERVAVAVGPGDDEGAAVHEGPEDLPHRHVEADRSGLQHPFPGGEPVVALHPVQAVRHARVRVDRALGAAGGARGVDDVRGVVVVGRHPRVLRGPRGVGCDPLEAVHVPVGDQQPGGGVVEDVGDPVGRVAGVDGHVCGTRLEHRPQGHHQVDRARQHHGDP